MLKRMSKEKMDKLQFENGKYDFSRHFWAINCLKQYEQMFNVDFFSGEQVLCYHGQHLYEAKIVKGKTTKNGNQKFLVHYDGWSKK